MGTFDPFPSSRMYPRRRVLEWRIRWFRDHRPTATLLVVIAIAGLFAAYVIYNAESSQLLVCPGCNLPEQVYFDHYTIQNNTSQKPSLLTVWFRSSGPGGKTLKVVALTLSNGQTTYDFTVQGTMIPALSTLPVNVDTSSQFYFAPNQTYSVGLLTDQGGMFGFSFPVLYPPQPLVQLGYTIGYHNGQTNATVLNLTLWNVGNSSETLSSIAIRDQSTNFPQFTFPMSGPTIRQPGATVQVTLDTSGSGFFFVHQHWYFLTLRPTNGVSSTSTIFAP